VCKTAGVDIGIGNSVLGFQQNSIKGSKNPIAGNSEAPLCSDAITYDGKQQGGGSYELEPDGGDGLSAH